MFKFDDTHPVTKDKQSFILRSSELEYLYQHIFEVVDKDREKVNYSITGINRIGKTSLMKELCRKFDESQHNDTFVLFTTLEGVDSFWPFWCGKVILPLIQKVDMNEIKDIDDDYYEQIEDIKEYFNDKEIKKRLYDKEYDVVEHEEAKERLELLLSLLGYCNKNILLIIDEFDLAAKAFGKNDSFFDWFRGLLQNENHPLSAVTISRRNIYYIEKNAFGGSTLSGTFKNYWIFGYKNSELDQYFSLLEENGCTLTSNQKTEVIYYCGRSPYYLSIMGNAILESKSTNDELRIGALFGLDRRYFYSFGRIIQILKEEKLYKTMLQLFIGPQYDLEQDKISELIGNGYCIAKEELTAQSFGQEYYDLYGTYEENYRYLTVCNSFIDYLSIKSKKDIEDIFPQLLKAEKTLRNFTIQHLKKQYDINWKDKIHEILFEGLYRNDKKRVEALKRDHARYLYQRENADNPEDNDDSILNIISIYELGVVIQKGCQESLKSHISMDEFNKGTSLLNKVRNPVAHCNSGIVPHDDIVAAKEFSDRIIKLIKSL